MLDKRKQIVNDVFAATGAKMEHDDPLVIAALYHSQLVREAGRAASAEMRAAAAEMKTAADISLAAQAATAAAHGALMKEIERQIARSFKRAAGSQIHAGDVRHLPVWHAAAGAIIVGIALATGWHFAFSQGTVHAQEAAAGRTLTRAVSTMDPKLRQQVIDHIRNTAG